MPKMQRRGDNYNFFTPTSALHMKHIVLSLLVCLVISAAYAQSSIGLPAIKNYKNIDYHAGTEIWDIIQDRTGVLYFANEDGLLAFDGSYWKLYPMPNKAAIRSMAIDSMGRIYVGGQDELGYFFPNSKGILTYHSLKALIPKKGAEGQFADIWNIVIINGEVFFRSTEIILRLKDNKVIIYDAPGGWRLLQSAGGALYAEDKTDGLLTFRDQQWQPVCPGSSTADLQITRLLDYKKDTLLVTTRKGGLYLLHGSTLTKKPTAADNILRNDLINCARKIGPDKYAIGTTQHGVLIIDSNGKLNQQFANTEGLQNTNILSLALDADENLWLGLENGIAFINYNTAVTHIYPEKDNQTTSNALAVFEGKLYIGTANGLYSTPLDTSQKDLSAGKGAFTEVDNTKGQVWSLADFHHQLLMGHQDGAFVIQHEKALPLMTRHGAWLFKPFPASSDIIAGTYTGLQLISYANGAFKYEGRIDSFYESLRVLAIDNNKDIWASHPYRGVFKIELAPDRKSIVRYTQYTQKDGLPADLNNTPFLIRNKIEIATEKGIYEYNPSTEKFVPSPFFTPLFKDSTIEYLTEDNQGNIWFVNHQHVGVIDFSKTSGQSTFSLIYFPELTAQTLRGFRYIVPYNPENIFAGSDNGVFHLNYSQYLKSDTRLKVLLSAVKTIAEKDSLIFGGYYSNGEKIGSAQDPQQIINLPNHWNSFHFEYSSTLYAQKNNVEFSYQLIGFDKGWSEWSVRTEKDYTNLPYGTYTFSVKARNNLGAISEPVNYTFVVAPAWYQTVWAYLGYLLILASLIRLLVKWQEKRFALQQKKNEEEQQRLSYLHSLELDRTEKEIIALQKEKLEGELQFKTKELATVTMHLVKRGGIVLGIKEELITLIKKLNIPDPATEFRSVFRMFNDIEKNDDEWNQFAIYFDQVHNNFISILKTKFPGLSSTDLKLCAYLRLNLSSKEIAQLLNISLKGVEISRYRIRKKLALSPEINLYDFLIEVTRTT
ncbi:MAG TPA: triple tyrosine motif-containing protein [Puia sp.]|nr:triple tyrosine motif-containing protein [Puia sp.]